MFRNDFRIMYGDTMIMVPAIIRPIPVLSKFPKQENMAKMLYISARTALKVKASISSFFFFFSCVQ